MVRRDHKGNIFIAQPPLFKVKKNKQECYVKDERALDDLLIHTSLDGATLFPGDGTTLAGSALIELVQAYYVAMAMINRYSKRYPKEFLEALMYAPSMTETLFQNREEMMNVLKPIQNTLNTRGAGTAYFEIELVQDKERHHFLPEVSVTSHGVKHKYLIGNDLFMSQDYRKLNALIKSGAYIERDQKKQFIQSFTDAVQWLLAEAKKGQTIQRYKGLGEMNPDQLWETTMDPSKRCLLQVKIEDAVAADQIFTTLMGDEVEPRRRFIETNALDVVNLDV